MPLMSFAQYARHRGCSKAAVTYAIRDGRITPELDHAGKTRINSELADRQWLANTAHEKRRNTGDVIPGVPHAPAEVRQLSPLEPVQALQIVMREDQVEMAPAMLGVEEKTSAPAGPADETYSKARAQKEYFAAKKAEIEYRKAAGELVEVSIIAKEWSAIASLVRTKVLGIPSKAKQRIPDLTHDQYLSLETIVRAALEDLSQSEAV